MSGETGPLEILEAARAIVEAAPPHPSPPICRACTHLGDAAGGPVFACQGRPGCAIELVLEADR